MRSATFKISSPFSVQSGTLSNVNDVFTFCSQPNRPVIPEGIIRRESPYETIQIHEEARTSAVN